MWKESVQSRMKTCYLFFFSYSGLNFECLGVFFVCVYVPPVKQSNPFIRLHTYSQDLDKSLL